MVKKATGSQTTKTVSKQGRNQPIPGGLAGQGKQRGTAMLPSTGLLSPTPGQTMPQQAKRQK